MKLNMQQAFFGALLGLWMAKVFEPALNNILLLGFLVVYGSTVVLLLSLATNTEVQSVVRFFLYGVSGVISAGFAAAFKTYVHPIVLQSKQLGEDELWVFFVIVLACAVFSEVGRRLIPAFEQGARVTPVQPAE